MLFSYLYTEATLLICRLYARGICKHPALEIGEFWGGAQVRSLGMPFLLRLSQQLLVAL